MVRTLPVAIFSAMLVRMEERIRKAIVEALQRAGASAVSFAVIRPTDAAHGDYATNAAMAAAKTLKKNPREFAEELAKEIKNALGESVSRVEVAGPGFINLTLSRATVTARSREAATKGDAWGRGTSENGKRINIEYANPNAFKEMHAGHLVGSVVGEALSRLIENAGATLARDTFGGDIGPNVAKALWGLQKKGIAEPTRARELGEAYAAGSNAYDTDPLAKTEIDALNQALYAGSDPALMALWRKGREVSMAEFRRLWRILDTHFDFEFFDSDTTELGLHAVQDGLAQGIFEKSDGAIIYDGEKKGVHTMVFITSHGTPTYETKDIGLALLREERWPADEVIILTGNEQTGRFKTVLAVLEELVPLLAKKTRHAATGFLKLTTGKMSSREGNVITAAELVADVTEKAQAKNPDPLIAEQVAVGAIKYMILRQSSGQDIMFDPEKSLSLEGDSGPYLQYALVRARSVLEKGGGKEEAGSSIPDTPFLLERLLVHFPEVAARAEQELAPHLLTTYLTELAGEWNSFYGKERIIGGEYEAYKLLVVRAYGTTMTNGLRLLGIPAPVKM